jgi:serine/threonine-protein kinase
MRHDTRAASSNPAALAARIVADAERARTPAVPGYELGTVIGTGGFGVVHRARDLRSDRLVALKVLAPHTAGDPLLRRRFQHEIEVQRRLGHPNVVRLYEHGTVGGAMWMAMEFCDRGSLADHAEAAGNRLDPAEATRLLLDVVAGLSAAHAAGYVHGDLKPHNVLLTGPEPIAKVGDFGLVRSVAGTSRTEATKAEGPRLGSWPYTAPEQLHGDPLPNPAADVWSAAATFYTVLAGVPPRAPVVAGGADPPDPVPIRDRRPDLPGPIAEVIDRSLATRVPERYEDARALQAALREVTQ